MTQKNEEIYYPVPIDDIQFTQGELIRMGIYFFEELNGLPDGLTKFGVYNVDPNRDLIDYGYILSQVGQLNNPYWVLYSKQLRFEYISDVWNKRNFYKIFKETESGTVLLFDKVYLRENYLKDDLSYYINLDLHYKESPYPVYSEYIQ